MANATTKRIMPRTLTKVTKSNNMETTAISSNLSMRVGNNATTMAIKSKLIIGMKAKVTGMANRTGTRDRTTTTTHQEIKGTARTRGTIMVTRSLATTMIRTKVDTTKTNDTKTKIAGLIRISSTILMTETLKISPEIKFKILKLVISRRIILKLWPSNPKLLLLLIVHKLLRLMEISLKSSMSWATNISWSSVVQFLFISTSLRSLVWNCGMPTLCKRLWGLNELLSRKHLDFMSSQVLPSISCLNSRRMLCSRFVYLVLSTLLWSSNQLKALWPLMVNLRTRTTLSAKTWLMLLSNKPSVIPTSSKLVKLQGSSIQRMSLIWLKANFEFFLVLRPQPSKVNLGVL